MAKDTGFLEFTRELPTRRPVEQRVLDYNEFILAYEAGKLNQQAARCMDCGVPFCQHGCPLGNVIPEFNDAVYRQNWTEAYEILSSTNNFPEFTGRVCPAPCESSCVLGINQLPVTIEEIEKHIIEIAFEKGLVQPHKPITRTRKHVAVVGSGPAGLAAAVQLNYAGHTVTVYERDDEAGGLLRYGIPDFKLEKWVVERRIDLMKEEGIIFQLNAEVGVNVPLNDLLRKFDAIVLAGGATIPRDLNIAGRQLNGIYFAMDFLTNQNKLIKDKTAINNLTAEGKHVVVIGGGDTGSDCVGTANRQGAMSVTQIELMPQPPISRTAYMPWPSFPMILKTTSSHEEGIERKWAITTKEFISDEYGSLQALKILDLEWKLSADGNPAQFIEIEGSERTIPCQLALLAMGFLHPQHKGLLSDLGVELDERGNIKATEKNYQTNIHKIFTAGDMRRGQSLVVWAINEGRECAVSVNNYLQRDK